MLLNFFSPLFKYVLECEYQYIKTMDDIENQDLFSMIQYD